MSSSDPSRDAMLAELKEAFRRMRIRDAIDRVLDEHADLFAALAARDAYCWVCEHDHCLCRNT